MAVSVTGATGSVSSGVDKQLVASGLMFELQIKQICESRREPRQPSCLPFRAITPFS